VKKFVPGELSVNKPNVHPPRDRIAEFCRRHHLRKLSLYGSVLRDDFRPDSDVDVLVDFEPNCTVGFEIFDIEEELSHLFGGHKVDLVREKYLNPRLRDRILDSAEVQYSEICKTQEGYL
jgi:predicted nucleotidyltransferase